MADILQMVSRNMLCIKRQYRQAKKGELIMDYKIVHKDKETGAKITTVYQDNDWIVDIYEYPDGTREEIYRK